MDLFMPHGNAVKKRKDPAPPDSFQKELKAKMRERKKRGLSVDVTPSASERESDDELGSDDELMAHFNMTRKHESKKKESPWKPPDLRRSPTKDHSPSSNRSKSPYDHHGSSPSDMLFGGKTPNNLSEEDDDDDDDDDDDGLSGPSSLMMTMKKPMKPMDFTRKDGTRTMPLLRKSKTLASVNEDDGQKEKKWSPLSAKKNTEDEKENQPIRPKSPNVRGRRTPTNLLDCIEEESKPKPSPRIRKREASDSFSRPVPQQRGRSPRSHISEENESEDEEVVKISSRGLNQAPQKNLFKSRSGSDRQDRKMTVGRKTPSSDRNSPSDGRKTPSDGRRTPSDGRRTPSDGRKTPSDGRKTPSDGRKTPSDGRKTPLDGKRTSSEGRKTPSDGRRTPSEGRRTPSDGRKTPETKKSMFSRKASSDGIFGRKTPTEDSKSTGRRISFGEDQEANDDSSPKVQKKSILDVFSSSSKETRRPKREDKRRSPLLAEPDSDSDVGMGAPRRSPSPVAKPRQSDGESRHSPAAQRGRGTPPRSGTGREEHDGVDGFRMSPSSVYKEHERASATFRRPSLKNRSGSPHDSLEQDGWNNDVQRPSLRRKDAGDEHMYDDVSDRHGEHESSSRSRRKTRQDDPLERESSVCRDVDIDPTMVKQKEKVRERKLAKTYTADGRIMEDAIMSVEDAQDNRMKYIEPDKTTDKEAEKEVSKKIPKRRPKPRYAKPVINTMPSPTSSSLSFNSSTDIRMAVYQEWYQEQLEKAKKELKEKKLKEKELERKEMEAKKEKLFEAKASYQSWLEKKKETLEKEKRRKKQKEEEEARKKREEEENKKKEAECTFRSWKETKDAYLRRELQRKKREEERKKEEEREKQRQKEKYSQRIFEKWKGEKDEKIKTEKVVEKKTKKQKEDEERRAQEERDRIALESYMKWLEKKEHYNEYEYRHSQKDEGYYEPRPAWSPASRTIPVGR